MKAYIVTCVDVSKFVSKPKPRVCTMCATRDEAKNYVKAEIDEWADNRAGTEIEVDYENMSAGYVDGCDGCEWSIDEIDIMPYLYKKNLTATEQVLIDNGIEEDEASTVLQAIGYSLLATELYPEED